MISKNIGILKRIGFYGWIYGMWHSKHTKEIPACLTIILRYKWKKGRVRAFTYDGSNQCVHPDVIRYKDKVYLTYTPYPYGIDIYENPQIAFYDEQNGLWKNNVNGPIIRPEEPDRMHYSDTFFCIHDDKLLLFYRLTDKENGSRSTLYYVVVNEAGVGNEVRFTDLFDYEYISPFIIEYNGSYLFHIERDEPNHLFVRKIDSFDEIIDNSITKEEVKLVDFDDNEWIWHLGVSSSVDLNSKMNENGSFLGVATCIADGDYSFYYNCLCELRCDNENWILKKIKRIDEKPYECKYSYKSCLCELNGGKQIIMSIIDHKHRHGLFTIPLSEVIDAG